MMLEQAETLIDKSRRLLAMDDRTIVDHRFKTIWSDTTLALDEAVRQIEQLKASLKEAVDYADMLARNEGMPDGKRCTVLTASCVPIEDADKDMPVARFDVAKARRLVT